MSEHTRGEQQVEATVARKSSQQESRQTPARPPELMAWLFEQFTRNGERDNATVIVAPVPGTMGSAQPNSRTGV